MGLVRKESTENRRVGSNTHEGEEGHRTVYLYRTTQIRCVCSPLVVLVECVSLSLLVAACSWRQLHPTPLRLRVPRLTDEREPPNEEQTTHTTRHKRPTHTVTTAATPFYNPCSQWSTPPCGVSSLRRVYNFTARNQTGFDPTHSTPPSAITACLHRFTQHRHTLISPSSHTFSCSLLVLLCFHPPPYRPPFIPSQTRYVWKYRAVDNEIVLRVTDDTQVHNTRKDTHMNTHANTIRHNKSSECDAMRCDVHVGRKTEG